MPIESGDPPVLDNQASRERVARKWLSAQRLAPLPLMMVRGAAGRCPVCGQGRLYDGFLRVVRRCAVCAAPLGLVRADDAPPYFTIFITAHLIIALVVISSRRTDPPSWVLIACFLPLTVLVAMLLLRPVKGATVATSLHLGLLGEP